MSPRHAKNPHTPPVRLALRQGDVRAYAGPLWRIHATNGPHPSAFDELRFFGPLPQCRWDPHPDPLGPHPGIGVQYAAPDHVTAFAEVFQDARAITLSGDRTLSGWMPRKAGGGGLELLDLVDTDWALHHGASASLPQAPRSTCRGWARAIFERFGGTIDGIRVPSTVVGDPMVVLFSRAARSFPSAPAFSRRLDHPDVVTLAARASRRLGWPLL